MSAAITWIADPFEVAGIAFFALLCLGLLVTALFNTARDRRRAAKERR